MSISPPGVQKTYFWDLKKLKLNTHIYIEISKAKNKGTTVKEVAASSCYPS
jgi:hypothetical protein